MKFSKRWLERMLAGDANTEAAELPLDLLLERLTLAGLEVDGHESLELDERVVVGRITEACQHPDADRLRVCTVDIGQDPLEIVCGAPNARAGIHVAVATIGAKLPGGLKIKKSKLRGVVSFGMLCSGAELALGDDHDGIIELAEAPLGTPLADVLGLPDDVIDVDLTPNRGDCFSLLGIARETAVFAQRDLPQVLIDDVDAASPHPFSARVDIPSQVPVFSYRVVQNIRTDAHTPLWMQERLQRSGVRPIHPVVDITNYVMLELGQPMHAYDLDKLNGNIGVRLSQRGESVALLDGQSVETDAATVLITDDSGPIGLGGIMGGATTAVDENTTNILFEAAFFSQAAMAGVARRYGLHTDASLRFERGVDPRQQERAQARAAALLQTIAGGEFSDIGCLRSEEDMPTTEVITLRKDRLARILGAEIDDAFVAQTFQRLGFDSESVASGWQVTPPSWRFDIAIEEDLIEEVARVYGYDNLPVTRAIAEVALAAHHETRFDTERARDVLSGRGFNEVITYSFVDPQLHDAIAVQSPGPTLLNPISSELSVMRGSLLPGLLQTAAHNVARQRPDLKFFEIGTVFGEESERQHLALLMSGRRAPEQWAINAGDRVDVYDLINELQAIAAIAMQDQSCRLVPAEFKPLHPGQSAEVFIGDTPIGYVGALHPGLAVADDIGHSCVVAELDLTQLDARVPFAHVVPKYPEVRRDIAVIVDDEVSTAALLESIRATADSLLQNTIVFDIYRGKGIEAGLKSVAFGLILQDSSRTLTDEEVDGLTQRITSTLHREHGAKLRE